jgi:L-cysteine S-thiosulfotransferase
LRLLLFLLLGICHAGGAADARRSGYETMGRETRAMQDDEATGPAVLWLLEGEALWQDGCARCHGDASSSMKGVAARYPRVVDKKVVNLEGQVNQCRVTRQKAPALGYESRELLALTAYVGRQSRGMPIDVKPHEPFLGRGKALYDLRQGQLNLSCAQCHEERAGRHLAGTPIPQGHATGYPLYRLEWQSLGSLQRRLRNCLTGMRAELFDFGAPELLELELYLAWRSRGMKLETPAVRP